ncbi:hypothetical protein HDU96_005056 [Phlyctochytrium bullatum]|nr:hypothetical protein HDU96_005056 [Phlyctochytrium bullatum]
MSRAQLAADLSHNDEERSELTLSDVAKTIRKHVFGIFFALYKSTDHSNLLSIAGSIIEHLQDLAFPLCFTHAPWQSEISWFRTLLSLFSFHRLVGDPTAVTCAILIVLGLLMLNFAWVAYGYHQSRYRFMWTLKLCRAVTKTLSSVFYVPALYTIVRGVAECPAGSELVECWKGVSVARSVGTCVLVLAVVALALCAKVTLYESNPTKSVISCRPHPRLDIAHLAARTVLTILTVFLQNYGSVDGGNALGRRQTATWTMAGACLVLSSGLAFASVRYLPFFHFRYALFRATLTLHFFWSSICLLFAAARPFSDIGLLFLLLSPLAHLVATYLAETTRHRMLSTPLDAVPDPMLFELQIRFRLEALGRLFPDGGPDAADDPPPGGDIEAAQPDPKALVAGCKYARLRDRGEEQRRLEGLVAAYKAACAEMPRSCLLHVYAAGFQLLYLGNRAQATATCARAETLGPRTDEAYLIFRQKETIKEMMAGVRTVDFVAYERNIKLARSFEQKAALSTVSFCSELLNRSPSLDHLESHGAAVVAAVSAAQAHYVALIEMCPDSPQVYRLYSNFMMQMLNDQEQADELAELAEELEENAKMEEAAAGGDGEAAEVDLTAKKGKDVGGVALDLFSDRNAIVTISGEPETLGTVINVNAAVTRFFGYRRNELVNFSVNKLLPSPFAEVHDMLMQKYLEVGHGRVIDQSRLVLGLRKNGLIFPTMICVKHVVAEHGRQNFIGILRPQKETDTVAYVILKENLDLLHFSKAFDDLVRRSAVPFGRSLKDWFPELTVEQITSKTGARVEMEAEGGEVFGLEFSGEVITLLEHTCVVCRATIKRCGDAAVEKGVWKEMEHGEGRGDGPMFLQEGKLSASQGSEIFDALDQNKANDDTSSLEQNDSDRASGSGRGSTTKRTAFRASADGQSRDGRSQGSRSSFSARTYVRRVVSIRNDHANRKLSLLNAAFVVCLFVLAVTAVVEFVHFRKVYRDSIAALSRILSETKISTDLISMADAVRSLDVARSDPWFWVDSRAVDNQTVARINADTLAKDLLAVGQVFIECDNKTVELFTLDYNNSKTFLTLGGVAFLSASAQFLARAGLDEFYYPSEAANVLLNAPFNVLKVTEACAAQDMQVSIAMGTDTSRTLLYTSVVGPCLCLLFILLLMQPLFVKVVVTKEQFLQMFLDIPKEVIKGIQASHIRKFPCSKRNMHLEMILAAQEDDNDEEEDLASKIVMDKVLNNAKGDNDGHDMSIRIQNSGSGRPLMKWISKTRNDRHWVLAKTMIVFVATCLYFFSVGGLAYQYMSTVDNVGAGIFWSSERMVYAKQTSYLVRELFVDLVRNVSFARGVPRRSTTVAVRSSTISWALEAILRGHDDLDSAILFGRRDWNLDGVLAKGPQNDQVMLELNNACVPDSPPDCATFDNQVMGRGIQSAGDWFQRRIRDIVKNITLAGSAADTSLLRDIDSNIALIRKMEAYYLYPAYKTATILQRSDLDGNLEWLSTFHMVSC